MSRALPFSSVALAAIIACAPAAESANTKSDSAMMQPSGDDAAARSAIGAASKSYLVAINAGDAATLTSFYADDAVSYQPNMDPLAGKAAIAEGMKGWMAAMKISDGRAKTDTVIVMNDLAVEIGGYTGTMTPTGGKAMQDRGRYINIWKRQPDGSWKIWRDIVNSSRPMPKM